MNATEIRVVLIKQNNKIEEENRWLNWEVYRVEELIEREPNISELTDKQIINTRFLTG